MRGWLRVFIIVGQGAPRRPALLAAAASLVWLGVFGFCGYPVFPALAAVLAGLAFLVPALGRAGPPPALIAAGTCAGIAMLFRYNIGFFTFGSKCVILTFSAWVDRHDRTRHLRDALHALSWFGLGFVVVVMPVAAAFAFSGTIPDLVFDVVTFP